jgi:hypothetical protein
VQDRAPSPGRFPGNPAYVGVGFAHGSSVLVGPGGPRGPPFCSCPDPAAKYAPGPTKKVGETRTGVNGRRKGGKKPCRPRTGTISPFQKIRGMIMDNHLR